MPFGTGYRSGRGLGVGAFSPPRTNQGIPMQPVPMSGQTGEPQTAKWSVADAIQSQTFGDEIDKWDWTEELTDEEETTDIADWDEWNEPRHDVERFYQVENFSPATRRERQFAKADRCRQRYLEGMQGGNERVLRAFIRQTLQEVNAISTGGGAGVDAGKIRGVVTPLGTGPTHPLPSDKRGTKKRNKKRNKRNAESFGGGKFID